MRLGQQFADLQEIHVSLHGLPMALAALDGVVAGDVDVDGGQGRLIDAAAGVGVEAL